MHCGENNQDLLEINHIDGGGRQERAKTKAGIRATWLTSAGLPRLDLEACCVVCHTLITKRGRDWLLQKIASKTASFGPEKPPKSRPMED